MTTTTTPSANRLSFRAWHKDTEQFLTVELIDFNNDGETWIGCKQDLGEVTRVDADEPNEPLYGCPIKDAVIEHSTGLTDKNGVTIYEGDILEFADKWEWYKYKYGIKMMCAEGDRLAKLKEQYEAEPMERRVIELPRDYEWLLSPGVQSEWQIIGNVHEHPELLPSK